MGCFGYFSGVARCGDSDEVSYVAGDVPIVFGIGDTRRVHGGLVLRRGDGYRVQYQILL